MEEKNQIHDAMETDYENDKMIADCIVKAIGCRFMGATNGVEYYLKKVFPLITTSNTFSLYLSYVNAKGHENGPNDPVRVYGDFIFKLNGSSYDSVFELTELMKMEELQGKPILTRDRILALRAKCYGDDIPVYSIPALALGRYYPLWMD